MGEITYFLRSHDIDGKHRQAQKKHKEVYVPEKFMFLSSSQTTFQ